MCKGEFKSESWQFKSTLYCTRSFTISRLLLKHARCNGVLFINVHKLGLALESSNSLTIPTLLLFTA